MPPAPAAPCPSAPSRLLRGLLPAAAAVALTAGAALPAAAETTVDRISGDDRFATAAALARHADADPDRVWLATGTDFADALAASATGEPVLLALADTLPTATAAALADLAPEQVTAVGGTDAIGDGVLTNAAGAAGAETARVAGADRFATAAGLSGHTHPERADIVWLAAGGNFADALAAAPAAAADDAPLLLVTGNALPEPTAAALERLDPDRVVITGGAGAVAEAVAEAAAAHASASVERVAGDSRFATATAIAAHRDDRHGASDTAYLATGADFPDALAAGPAAAADDAPLLLAVADELTAPTRDALVARGDDRVRLVGGSNALSDAVAEHAARPEDPPPQPGVCDPYDATAAGTIQGHPEGPRLSLDAWSGPWMIDHFRQGWELAVPYRWRFDVVNDTGHGGVLFYEDSEAGGGDPYAHRYALTVFCGNPFQVAGGRELGDDTAEVAEHGPHSVLGRPDVERTDRPGVVYSAEWHDLGNTDPADDHVQRYDYVTVGGDVLMLHYAMENRFARDHAGQTGGIADAVTASLGPVGGVTCPANAGSCRTDRDRTQGGTPP